MHYINGGGGLKTPKEKFKFINLLAENANTESEYYLGVSGSVVERRTLWGRVGV